MTRQSVIEEAMTWLRTPYHNCAKVKGHGVDCGMLLIMVYSKALGMPEFDPGKYSPEWHLHRSEEIYLKYVQMAFEEIPLCEAKAADALVYKYGRTWSHGAILINDTQVIHAYKGYGVIISGVNEHPLDIRHEPRAFKFKGL